MADKRSEGHPISFLVSQVTIRSIPYQLRSGNTRATETMKRIKKQVTFSLLHSRDSIIISEFKHGVYGRRQTAKMTSEFVFFSSNP